MLLIPPGRMIFHDEFGEVLPSASINGSNATSETGLTLPAVIGGARTAVDTEANMSIIPNFGTALATHAGVTMGGSYNRNSYADGFAWMDFPTGFDAAAHAGQGRIVVMYDSSGRAAWSYLGAAGSGETLGNDLLISGVCANSATLSPYNTFDGASINGYHAIGDGAAVYRGASTARVINYALGNLYQVTFNISLSAGALPFVILQNASGGTTLGRGAERSFSGDNIYYSVTKIADTGVIAFYNNLSEATEYTASNITLKTALTPSATGCWVYPTLAAAVVGDTAQSGWNKPTAFNMNSATYTFGIHQPTSGGRLFFQGGKATPAYGDAALWEPYAVTRPGTIIAFKLSTKDATLSTAVRLDTAKTGDFGETKIQIASDTLLTYDGATAGPVTLTPVDSTDYVLVIITRTAGAQFLIKTGNGYYRRIPANSVANTATLYAALMAYSAAAFYDWVRIPKTRYIFPPVASDSFTGTAGSNDSRIADGLGHAETTGLGSGGAGVVWSGASGAVDGSGRLVITPTVATTGGPLNDGNLFTNGTFDTDASWTKGAGWTIDTADSNAAEATAAAGNLTQAGVAVVGNFYRLSATVVDATLFYPFSPEVLVFSPALRVVVGPVPINVPP